MIKIIFEDNHLLVVEKPFNMPVNSDSSKDENLLDLLKEDLKRRYNKPGEAYLGLVHRLDRPVGGVMVFAKTSKAASRLSKQIRDLKFSKTYLAVVEGKTPKQATYKDRILKDTKTNISKVDAQGKLSTLQYKTIKYKDNLSLVEIDLLSGRSHQIRVQFSFHNFPLWGDQKYNKNTKPPAQIALFSHKLSFFHPITNEQLVFTANTNEVPFNLFN